MTLHNVCYTLCWKSNFGPNSRLWQHHTLLWQIRQIRVLKTTRFCLKNILRTKIGILTWRSYKSLQNRGNRKSICVKTRKSMPWLSILLDYIRRKIATQYFNLEQLLFYQIFCKEFRMLFVIIHSRIPSTAFLLEFFRIFFVFSKKICIFHLAESKQKLLCTHCS